MPSHKYRRICAWIDAQPIIENANINDNIWSEMNGRYEMFPIDAAHSETASGTSYPDIEFNLQELMDQLRRKKIYLLPRSSEELQEAFESQLPGPRRAMRPAKASHNFNSRVADPEHEARLLHTKALFNIAHSGHLTPAIIRAIIPSNITLDCGSYGPLLERIARTVEDCYYDALSFVGPAVEGIVEIVDELCGDGFFANLTRKERYAIFIAAFNQFPAWTMSKFKQQENEVVDFDEIFRKAIRRRDLVEKRKWRRFFQYGFVLVCEKMFLWQQNGGVFEENEVRNAWNWVGKRERARELGLGGAYDLPARGGIGFERRA